MSKKSRSRERFSSSSCKEKKMFSEYAPFVTKYFYHILVAVVSFVLFSKIFGRPDDKRSPRSGTHVSTASDESTDPSESNVTADTCNMLCVTVERNRVVFVSF